MIKNKKGFSLVELIVVIAVMAVLIAVLAPSLLTYTERSRAQKDLTYMDEVTNAVMLTMSDSNTYDEAMEYSTANNVSCYIDKEDETQYDKQITKTAYNDNMVQYTFGDDARKADETVWYAAGNMRGLTITLEPVEGPDGQMQYVLADAIINKFYGKQGRLGDTKYLYNALRQTIGDDIIQISQTYRNSEYTIFVVMGTNGGNQAANQDAITVYGQYSGTNLPTTAPTAYAMTKNRNQLTVEDEELLNPNQDNTGVNVGGNNSSFTPMQVGQEYVLFDGTTIVLNEDSVSLYMSGQLVATLPQEAFTVDIDNKTMTVHCGDPSFDGVYKFYDSGYVEKDGHVIAKASDMWLDVEEDTYFVVHNGAIYISADGNVLLGNLFEDESMGGFLEAAAEFMAELPDSFFAAYPYQFGEFNMENLTAKNVYDLLAVMNMMKNTRPVQVSWRLHYNYWGAYAQDSIVGNALVTNAEWTNNVTGKVTTRLMKVNSFGEREVMLNEKLDGMVIRIDETSEYYWNGEERCPDVFFVEDVPFPCEPGMTYREWIHSEYSKNSYLTSDFDNNSYSYFVYIPEERLDDECSGVGQGIPILNLAGITWKLGQSDYYDMIYCDGTIDPIWCDTSSPMFTHEAFEYAGVWYGEGQPVKKQIISYEIYNYYLKNNPWPNSHEWMGVYQAFKLKNDANVVDISTYIMDRNGYSVLDYNRLAQEFGIDTSTELKIARDGEYIINAEQISSYVIGSDGVMFIDGDTVYIGWYK